MRKLELCLASLVALTLVACGDDDGDDQDMDASLPDSTSDATDDGGGPDAPVEEVECFSGTPECDYWAEAGAAGACPTSTDKCTPGATAPDCQSAGAHTAYQPCATDADCVAK